MGENNRQRAIEMVDRAQNKENWPTRADKIKWMEEMRASLLSGLEKVIDANFSKEEAVYVRRLPYYRWTRRDIAHDKSAMGLFLRGHDDFYHVVNDFMEELGLPLVRNIGYGLPGEERPTGDRVAKLAAEHGRTVHGWIEHAQHKLEERAREIDRRLEEDD